MRTSRLVALYPARWRARYGEELEALLDEVDASPGLIADIVRGAVSAHVSGLPDGGTLSMHRSRTLASASVFAFLLVLPGVTFLGAAAIRSMQPAIHEPARTANAIFDFFATALPQGWMPLLLGVAPLVAFALALFVGWRRLTLDDDSRDDLRALMTGFRRVGRQPLLVAVAFTLAASAALMTFAVVHAIAG